jgi:PKD repeat protein
VTVEIPIRDEFTDPNGQFVNYDCYDPTQAAQINKQQHVDIRSFIPAATHTLTMLDFDALAMSALESDTMTTLESTTATTRPTESWSSGAVGTTAFNNWRGLTLTLANGTNTTSSVMTLYPVNISGLANTDVISVALPSFPAASVTQASSFIDFTSEPTGNFGIGPTDSIAFSASTVVLTAGHSELRFPISSLTNINKNNITGVRFRIQATGAATFTCLAIRALSANWVLAPTDTNSLYNRIVRPPSLNGDPAASPTFPSSPTSWPILFRSATPPGTADPRPIDAATSLVFTTGSRTAAGSSSVALYFREIPLDQNTQLDLEGTYTQDDLNRFGTSLITNGGTPIWSSALLPGQRVQPDFGRALYDPRQQAALEQFIQSELDADSQFSLERVQDTVSAAYLEVKVTWDSTGTASITVKNESGVGQTFSATLSANTAYLLLGDVVDNTIRARIFTLDSQRYITGTLFDSTTIVDDSFVNRRKGRVGWYTLLKDGDAHSESFELRSTNFGEYISLPFTSDTPVTGARLNAHSSPALERVSLISKPLWGGVVTADTSLSNSGKSYKVSYDQVNALQGFQTNGIPLDNLSRTHVEFDIYRPTGTSAPFAFLYGKLNRVIELSVPGLPTDSWQHVRLSLDTYNDKFVMGDYNFVMLTTAGPAWYIDNVSISTRVIAWDGRGNPLDPWLMDASQWLPFSDTVNGINDGLVFDARGTGMQVRGRAIRQTASITDLTVRPKFAELGRFAWPDQGIAWKSGLTPSFSSSVNGSTVTFTSTSTSSGDPIIAVIWSYGDGVSDFGFSAAHTYAASGTYPVTVTVIDTKGQRKSATGTVTV